MSIQATLPSDIWTRVSAMATDKKPRVSEAYSFQEFPLKKLGLKKPEFVTKSVFSIPELKDNVRMPFINLTPTAGEWLRVCFDVDTNHASTLKDDKGVPVAFKLVIDVKDKQEELTKGNPPGKRFKFKTLITLGGGCCAKKSVKTGDASNHGSSNMSDI